MSNDYQKKQPTKNEQMIFELYRHMQSMERSLWSNSSFVTALAYLTKQDPKKVAEILAGDQKELHEYSDQINKEIRAIEEKKKAEAKIEEDDKAKKVGVE